MQWKKILLLVSAVALLVGFSQGSGNTFVPGSNDDPLVSKSYVDEQIGLINKSSQPIDEQVIKTLKAQLKTELLAEINQSNQKLLESVQQANTLIVVTLAPGQMLQGFEGTEFIVRKGLVVAKSSASGDGLPNVTGGKNIENGFKVPENHLILIPKNDGRGLLNPSTEKNNAIIMVRGKFNLIKP